MSLLRTTIFRGLAALESLKKRGQRWFEVGQKLTFLFLNDLYSKCY